MQGEGPPSEASPDETNSGSSGDTRRTFLKGAAGASAALVGTGLSGSAAADGPLVVDDYQEPTQWSNDQNDLGNWTGAGGWQSQDVSGGTLTLEYQDNAWYKTKVSQDVSAYDRIAIEARGATGSEAQDLELTLGDTTDTLANLSGQSLGDSFTTLTIPFSEVSFDATTQSTLTLNAPWGTSGTVELEELRFESSGSSIPKPEPQIYDLPGSATTGEYVSPTSGADPQTSTVELVTWNFGDGTTSHDTNPSHAWDSAGTYEVTLTYRYSDDTEDSTSQSVDVASETPVANFSVTYGSPSNAGEFTATVTLENPAVLDDPAVAGIVYYGGEDDLTVESEFGFDNASGDTWEVDMDADVVEMTLSGGSEAEQEFTEQFDDGHLYHLGQFAPDLYLQSKNPSAVTDLSYAVDGDGFVSTAGDALYFGGHSKTLGETAQGYLSVIFPDPIESDLTTDEVHQGLSEVADRYYTDHETERVKAVRVEDFANATGYGGDRAFGIESALLNDVGATWIHELWHTLENFRQEEFDSSLRWFVEGSATYVEAIAPLELEHGPYDSSVYENNSYREFARAIEDAYDAIDLRDPANYGGGYDAGGAEYDYGAHVCFGIDRRVRQATDGKDLFDVLAHMYEIDEEDGDATPVYDHEAFLSAIEHVAGPAVRDDADAYIKSDEIPDIPDPQAFSADFGFDVPAPSVRDVRPIVNGAPASDEVRVTENDSLAVEVDVENFGTGSVTVTMELFTGAATNTLVDKRTVTIPSGTTETLTVDIGRSYTAPAYANMEATLTEFRSDISWVDQPADKRTGFVVAEPDTTLVYASDDTTQSDPAQLDQGTRLGLVTPDTTLKELVLEQVDGDDRLSFYPTENLGLGHVEASELVAGATYEITFSAEGTTQYVTVAE